MIICVPDPAQGQSNGSFTKSDHDSFMKRMEEWKEKGYRIGASWGIFSMGIPHRVRFMTIVISQLARINVPPNRLDINAVHIIAN